MQKEIGQKINELRTSKGLTLKELSEKTNLSVSFLSQAERGLTSIAFMSLKRIAEAMDVDLTYFFDPPKNNRNMIVRSYEQEIFKIQGSKLIHYNLGGDIPGRRFDPMVVTIIPSKSMDEAPPYAHDGEEFVYVLEGIFTLILDDVSYEMYPGDSAHIPSNIPHNWINLSNKLVKILAVNAPSMF